ncbi:hypothetical protein AAVH_25977 [Aphelenchoides avenae]|nr:hypothetical protein AAVH_25977 [Aphelenchus avenae]
MLPVDDAPLVRPPPPELPCEGILTMMFVMLGPLGIIGATIVRHYSMLFILFSSLFGFIFGMTLCGKLKSKVRKRWQESGKSSRKDADPERGAALPIRQAS